MQPQNHPLPSILHGCVSNTHLSTLRSLALRPTYPTLRPQSENFSMLVHEVRLLSSFPVFPTPRNLRPHQLHHILKLPHFPGCIPSFRLDEGIHRFQLPRHITERLRSSTQTQWATVRKSKMTKRKKQRVAHPRVDELYSWRKGRGKGK
ncbi:hypothetical protein TbgDal_VIII1250 [Trypanosoma brucei gambiense DAL972]|uniref:T. brucei spp.-specific protein n=1 Tax=Trypanosoma brucei gambiense (strain MHOM/CI/86/DAL972) TaxID=679716 RepID=C9ZUT7_TRYB9|nr:hypothetical protein TbgDal_VIII1250 [Trypanosoma brucei gambiense DAL972]CBH13175.1 hypothetical protein TbgDal_VIII1250 [Trypanosoma brucei gambiense DAL972]|eukprot:XP_011775452.1 hypothetical protein TbgDal_VIII1250 [Trypanosoma brucei gambiense DAL972]